MNAGVDVFPMAYCSLSLPLLADDMALRFSSASSSTAGSTCRSAAGTLVRAGRLPSIVWQPQTR